MATYTPLARLVKQATNENKGTWGAVLNAGLIDLLDVAVKGKVDVSMASGNYALTVANGAADEARYAVVKITATGGVTRTLTIPSLMAVNRIHNAGTSAVLVKTAAGVGVTVLQGQIADIYCDGVECYRGPVRWGLASSTTLSGASNFNLNLAVTGQPFNDALIVIKQNTAAVGTTRDITLVGAGGTTAALTTTVSSGAPPISGGFFLPGLTMDAGFVSVALSASLAANATSAKNADADIVWRMTGGLTALGYAVTGGNNHTGGTAEVWLR